MNEPRMTAEQAAWFFNKLCEHMEQGGTFRKLIYDRMGFSPSDYETLYRAGGMAISNVLNASADIAGIVDKLATDRDYSQGEAIDDIRVALGVEVF